VLGLCFIKRVSVQYRRCALNLQVYNSEYRRDKKDKNKTLENFVLIKDFLILVPTMPMDLKEQ